MNKYYKQILFLERKVNALSGRERGLLLLVVLGIIYYLWQAIIFTPIGNSKATIAAKIKLAQQQITQITGQTATIEKTIQADPKYKLAKRIELLRQDKEKYATSVAALVKTLIPPQAMVELLREILTKDQELVLLNMENIPEQPVFKQLNEKQHVEQRLNNKPEANKIQLYKHGVKLELTGTYFATCKFLQALEKLPWKLLWSELQYEVTDYPYASIKMIIYTLSLQTSYIGM